MTGPALRYQDNGDGTITDLNTGLMWEKKVAGTSSPATLNCLVLGLHNVNSDCEWLEATGDWINAVNAEGGTGYAGHSDWRVPNIKELQSIVDYRRVNLAIDPSFPGLTASPGSGTSSCYWSSTPTVPDNPVGGWFVDFRSGIVTRNLSGYEFYSVRAVRGGQ